MGKFTKRRYLWRKFIGELTKGRGGGFGGVLNKKNTKVIFTSLTTTNFYPLSFCLE